MTGGPTLNLSSGTSPQIYRAQLLCMKQGALVVVKRALELSSVNDAVLVVVERFKHLSPLLRSGVVRNRIYLRDAIP